MTQEVRENVTGPLNNPSDFLRALQGLVNDFNKLVRAFNTLSDTPMTFAQIVAKPTTLSGYGIIDAAPLHHTHVAADILDLPTGFSGVVAWSAITGKPYTVDGFGIIDASKVGHKHHWSDILDPPPVGVGPAGPPGPPSTVPGPPGPATSGMPGLDGLVGPEAMMIPGPAGKPGRDGKTTPPVLWFETSAPLEPLIVPGGRGSAGPAGPPGAPGSGSSSHEGVLAFGQQPPPEPLFVPMVGKPLPPASAVGDLLVGRADGSWARLPIGPDRTLLTSTGPINGPDWEFVNSLAFFGAWISGNSYSYNDAVSYNDSLWQKSLNNIFPNTTPPDLAPNDWTLVVSGVHQHQSVIGSPSFPAPAPIEPMIVPGPKGKDGAAGGGGFAMLTAEVNLRAAPACARSGKFQIAGAGMTPNKPVYIQQAAAPYTGKGTRADEAEMDNIEVKAFVLDATHIQAYWSSRTRVRGNFKFNYAVGA